MCNGKSSSTHVKRNLSSILHYACHIPCRVRTKAGVIFWYFAPLVSNIKSTQKKCCCESLREQKKQQQQQFFLQFLNTQLPVFSDFGATIGICYEVKRHAHKHLYMISGASFTSLFSCSTLVAFIFL